MEVSVCGGVSVFRCVEVSVCEGVNVWRYQCVEVSVYVGVSVLGGDNTLRCQCVR